MKPFIKLLKTSWLHKFYLFCMILLSTLISGCATTGRLDKMVQIAVSNKSAVAGASDETVKDAFINRMEQINMQPDCEEHIELQNSQSVFKIAINPDKERIVFVLC